MMTEVLRREVQTCGRVSAMVTDIRCNDGSTVYTFLWWYQRNGQRKSRVWGHLMWDSSTERDQALANIFDIKNRSK
jgi:hypothetical protein